MDEETPITVELTRLYSVEPVKKAVQRYQNKFTELTLQVNRELREIDLIDGACVLELYEIIYTIYSTLRDEYRLFNVLKHEHNGSYFMTAILLESFEESHVLDDYDINFIKRIVISAHKFMI